MTHAAPGKGSADTQPLVLASSNNVAAAAIAILQIGFAVYGLYTVRASQLERFGYAAYIFTVIPFALMSVLNLAVLILTPKYPVTYMVRYGELDSGRQWTFPADSGLTAETVNAMMPDAIGSFSVVYGRPDITSWVTRKHNVLLAVLFLILNTLTFIIILCFTRFDGQQSTLLERAWTMVWLASGPICLIIYDFHIPHHFRLYLKDELSCSLKRRLKRSTKVLAQFILLILPGIGGYCVVISMLRRDETCIKV